jgi:hypothetical protein
MQTSSLYSTHLDDSLRLGASMSGCAVPEQRGTLSPVGSSWSTVELLSDGLDPSPGFGHVRLRTTWALRFSHGQRE